VTRALDEVPALNGYWRNDRHEPQEAIHLGVAVSLRQGGLVVPALRHADQKSLDELRAGLDDLITRARSGRLRSSELTEATITVTNLGDLGVETVHGLIYPPQVALVGFGKITERPWAEDGMLGVRPAVTATLAADHRATDGRQGAKFLDAINHLLQDPDSL
jgi:pyruvate dehydrogenase E2 component (dihydrolipoamide acetyltransferase)